MKKLINTIKVIISVILIVAGAGVAFIALPIFGNQALIVRSGSMLPTIKVGDIIVVRPLQNIVSPVQAKPKYSKGEIIAFRSERNSNTIITHRITNAIVENGKVIYKTKGDANEEEDGWEVKESQILGSSFFIAPYMGKILTFAKSKYGFPALIIFPAVIVILLEIFNIINELKKHKPKKEEIQGFPNSPTFFINFKPLKIIIPILAAGVFIPTTLAFYKDTETSTGNVLQAAAVFPTNIQSDTVTPTITEPTPTGLTLPEGSGIVINEIMWMGSSGGSTDEWIELRNTTNNSIDLANWTLDGAATGATIITIPSGSIPANGLFLISNFAETDASSRLNITPDLVTTTLQLDDSNAQIILKNNSGQIIDTADDGTGVPLAGINGALDASMERNNAVGDGSLSANWHTATESLNFDVGSIELGTPKATNSL